MLLTGFDSKYLNTLYVDKNLKYHGLIQAFSRTNRVLNDTKPYGNILDFRQQQDAVDAAIGPLPSTNPCGIKHRQVGKVTRPRSGWCKISCTKNTCKGTARQ
jgi:type I restriction enzyme R subunit